jgi:hypothetical protein
LVLDHVEPPDLTWTDCKLCQDRVGCVCHNRPTVVSHLMDDRCVIIVSRVYRGYTRPQLSLNLSEDTYTVVIRISKRESVRGNQDQSPKHEHSQKMVIPNMESKKMESLIER